MSFGKDRDCLKMIWRFLKNKRVRMKGRKKESNNFKEELTSNKLRKKKFSTMNKSKEISLKKMVLRKD